MEKRLLIILFAVTAQAVLSAGPQSGIGPTVANLWIDTDGGSCVRQAAAGPYVDAQACSSMQAALTAGNGGDTIVIRDGTYGSQSLASGVKSSTVSFFAQDYGSVLVNGLSIDVDKVSVTGVIGTGSGNGRAELSLTSSGTGTKISHARFKRMYISGDHITVEKSEFCDYAPHSTGEEDCVQVWDGSRDIALLNNIFHDCHGSYDTTYHNDMIQFYPGGDNIIIDGNVFYNGPTSNIQAGGGSLGNWVVQNNYFGEVNSPGNSFAFGQASPCTGLIYRNNVHDNGMAVNTGDCSGNVEISGNIFTSTIYACTTGGSPSVSGGNNVFSSGSTCGTNAARCQPSWLNGPPSLSNGYDIRLSPGDTCAINRGNPSSFASTDFYGTKRPQGSFPDAGAYEYAEGQTCIPSCASKECGDEGCAGSCGICASGVCDSQGQCIVSCTPTCRGKQCGDDGCGGSCGTCSPGQSCMDNQCASESCQASGTEWKTAKIAQQTGRFLFEADVIPTSIGTDSLVGLAPSAGTDFADFAVLVRFNTTSYIDGINAGGYAADYAMRYTAGDQYHIRMIVDVPLKRYSLYVTPQDTMEILVISNYPFRTAQANALQLSYWGHIADIGGQMVCDARITECLATDTDCDGCTSQDELLLYIQQWKSGKVTLANLMEVISAWKKGC